MENNARLFAADKDEREFQGLSVGIFFLSLG